jgi:hypothetical protein
MSKVVKKVAKGIKKVASKVVSGVKSVGRKIDQTVRKVVPGGWLGAAALGGIGYLGYNALAGAGASTAGAGAATGMAEVAKYGALGAGSSAWAGNALINGGLAYMGMNAMGQPQYQQMDPEYLQQLASGAGGGFSDYLPYLGMAGNAAIGAYSADKAADIQAQSAREARDLQYKMFQEQNALQEPWRQAGVNALSEMQTTRGNMPEAFSGKVDLTQDPGYAFRLSEGIKAMDRGAAARGGLISGNALKAGQRFGQDLASQEYGNAYNRALTEYEARVQREATGYNRLSALAGVGQTAAGNLSNAAAQYGTNAGNIGMMAGNARASGYMGAANALSGALGQGLNYYQNQQLMNNMPYMA